MLTTASSRTHIVLVPGFAGFDALGQIEYYAGVTPVFQRWRASSKNDRAVLHYFDNLPTASVATRGKRLAAYVAKRIARREFQRGDTLALIGHSTGGLDIRRMIRDLTNDSGAKREGLAVDGGKEVAARVLSEEILGMQLRLVFLSVPQYGTNIADWVRAHPLERTITITSLRANVVATRLPKAEQFQQWVANHAASITNSDLFRAVHDALTEMDENAIPLVVPDRAVLVAAAHEAESEIALWLRHIATDFGAIDDLAAGVPANGSSPAQFNREERNDERAAWRQHHIKTRSYATLGPRPFHFEDQAPVPVFNPYVPWGRPVETGLTGTDVTYRACYRACAGGPFAYPTGTIPQVTLFAGQGEPWPLTAWDNDGIVNTASMLWPDGDETRLVHVDHADIIGHFRRLKAPDQTCREFHTREFHTYDLLGSASQFQESDFEKVWHDVFEFCR